MKTVLFAAFRIHKYHADVWSVYYVHIVATVNSFKEFMVGKLSTVRAEGLNQIKHML